MTSFFNQWLPYDWAWAIATICGILLIALPLMLGVAMIIYADRKIWAAMALRRGPNVVGPFGLLQSFADGAKVVHHENIIPSAADKGRSTRARSWPISTSGCSTSSRFRRWGSTAR
jgi:NADH-quinone oxidoreductase subunit H